MNKEREKPEIADLDLEGLFILDELLNLEEHSGKDVTEAREAVWRVVNRRKDEK